MYKDMNDIQNVLLFSLRYQMAILSTTLHPLMFHVFPKMWFLSLTGAVL
jgi:hypothetical protein